MRPITLSCFFTALVISSTSALPAYSLEDLLDIPDLSLDSFAEPSVSPFDALSVISAYSEDIKSLVSSDKSSESWARLKVTLPDGLAFEEEIGNPPVIPMMDIDYPATPKKFLYRHQHESEGIGYKRLGMSNDEELFDPVLITPLSLSEEDSPFGPSIQSNRRYKQLFGLKDDGDAELINIPTSHTTFSVKKDDAVSSENSEDTNPSVQEKFILGIDSFGRKRYLDIPYYNRASNNP